MRILSFLCSLLLFGFLMVFSTPCEGQEKIPGKTVSLYEACIDRCNRSDTLGILTSEGCLKGCAESRRTFPLRNKKYSSSAQCLKDMEALEVKRDLLIEEAQEWCTEQWLHLHKRKGCKDAVQEFYTAATPNNFCWNAPSQPSQSQPYIPPQPLYESPPVMNTPTERNLPSLVPLTDSSIRQQPPSSRKRTTAATQKKNPVPARAATPPASTSAPSMGPATAKAPQQSNATGQDQQPIPPSPSQKTSISVPPLASGSLSTTPLQQPKEHALPMVPSAGAVHLDTPTANDTIHSPAPIPDQKTLPSGTIKDALLPPPTPGLGI